MHMLKMSGVGVTMAATTKMSKIAYRKFFHMNLALTIPINERKKIRIGISKIRPMPRMMLRKSDVYSEMVIMGWNCLPKMNQEAKRLRVDHLVTEVSAGRKQRDR